MMQLYPRRQFLQAGVLGTLGLTVPRWLRCQAETAAPSTARNAILVWLGGGPSHHDTLDPKSDAVAEIRGPYMPIATSVPGVFLAESLPHLARQMHRFAIVRSVTHPDAAHEPGTIHMQTGYAFRPGSSYPSIGAIVGHENQARSAANGLPPSIVVPRGGLGAGHLGPAHNPFEVGGNPNDPAFQVQDIALPAAMTRTRLQRRHDLLEQLDADFRSARTSELQGAIDRFTEQAVRLMTSSAAQQAFLLEREPERTRAHYGRTTLGQGLLLSRRLIEAGVPFVTVNDDGWDHHVNIYPELDKYVPPLDRGVSALLDDLAQRGLLESTLVIVMGEFGRTPRINLNRGRDHWSRCFSMIFAGGGVRGGHIVGASDREGATPIAQPVSPEDVAATIYTLLGIDPDKELPTLSGRPIQIVRDGRFIRDLT